MHKRGQISNEYFILQFYPVDSVHIRKKADIGKFTMQ